MLGGTVPVPGMRAGRMVVVGEVSDRYGFDRELSHSARDSRHSTPIAGRKAQQGQGEGRGSGICGGSSSCRRREDE